jgi:peptidoglycan hydrolase-like protein with peptidoglycan-binding domain
VKYGKATAACVAVASVTVVVDVQPASADNYYYPSGCETLAFGGWSDLCYTGIGFWDDDVTAVGTVQGILKDLLYGVTIDCQFGTQTKDEVKFYQFLDGISPNDGVVGPTTWRHLQNELTFYRSSFGVGPHGPTQTDYYIVGAAGPTRFEKLITGFASDDNSWRVDLFPPGAPFGWKYIGHQVCS